MALTKVKLAAIVVNVPYCGDRRASAWCGGGVHRLRFCGIVFTVPFRIKAQYRIRSGCKSVATVELERLAAVILVVALAPGEGFHRGGGHLPQHFLNMRTAFHL